MKIHEKKEHDGSKYATATNEAEFHAALKRGLDVELTRELAESIGVPMNEDVGNRGRDRPGAKRPPRLGTEAQHGKEILLAARGRLREEKSLTKSLTRIKRGVAPWQKPWKPGEQISAENFSTGKKIYRR